MTKKQVRQSAIRDLVSAHVVASQEELRQLLLARGMDVTQATLSRDVHDIGLARVSAEEGVRYVLPGALAGDDDNPLLANLLPQLFSAISGVGELIETVPDRHDVDAPIGVEGFDRTIVHLEAERSREGVGP